MGFIAGLGGSPGGGHSNPFQHSYLENPMDRGAWRASAHGVAKSQVWLQQWACTQELARLYIQRNPSTSVWVFKSKVFSICVFSKVKLFTLKKLNTLYLEILLCIMFQLLIHEIHISWNVFSISKSAKEDNA